MKEGSTSWRALEEIYNYNFGRRDGLGGLVDDFWEGMLNCQAVRNRLKVAKNELRRAINDIAGGGGGRTEDQGALLGLWFGSGRDRDYG